MRSGVRSVQAERRGLSLTGTLLTMPLRKRFTVTNCIVGAIGTGIQTAGVTGFFTVTNSVSEPFNTTAKPDSATGFIAETNGSDTAGVNGYSLLVQMYRFARVERSRLRVTCVPSTAGDQTVLCIFAIPQASAAGLPFSYRNARAQPFFKETMCYVGNRLQENTVDSSAKSCDVLGLSHAQYDDQPMPTFAAGSAEVVANQWVWVVQYFIADGTTNGNSIAFRIEYAADQLVTGPVALVG